MTDLNLDDLKVKLVPVDRAYRSLSDAFIWEHSREGHKYWSDVYDKLVYYATLAKDERND